VNNQIQQLLNLGFKLHSLFTHFYLSSLFIKLSINKKTQVQTVRHTQTANYPALSLFSEFSCQDIYAGNSCQGVNCNSKEKLSKGLTN